MLFHLCGERVNFCFPQPYHPHCLSSPYLLWPLSLLAILPLVLRLWYSMEMGALICKIHHHQISLYQSQPALGSLLLILGVVHRNLPFHTLLVHLPCLYRLSFGGKDQAKELKQVLLGRQPRHFITFFKKDVVSLPPIFPFFPYFMSLPSPWSFYLSFSLRTMKISSMLE